MRGNIAKQGREGWQLKFNIKRDASGKRKTIYVTVRGKRQDAQRELTRLLAEADADSCPTHRQPPSPNTSTTGWTGSTAWRPKLSREIGSSPMHRIHPPLGVDTIAEAAA